MLRTATAPAVITVTVNNTPSNSAGWFNCLFSGVRVFADAHPYIVYAVVGCTVGAAVYIIGGSTILGRTAESALADSASTARLIQRNANLRAEMETARVSMAKVCDALTEVKLELAHVQASTLVELTQQRQATDLVVRETAELLIAVNTSVLGVHESITQLAAASGHRLVRKQTYDRITITIVYPEWSARCPSAGDLSRLSHLWPMAAILWSFYPSFS